MLPFGSLTLGDRPRHARTAEHALAPHDERGAHCGEGCRNPLLNRCDLELSRVSSHRAHHRVGNRLGRSRADPTRERYAGVSEHPRVSNEPRENGRNANVAVAQLLAQCEGKATQCKLGCAVER